MRLQLHDAIHRPDSFVSMLRYCANLKYYWLFFEKRFWKLALDKNNHEIFMVFQKQFPTALLDH